MNQLTRDSHQASTLRRAAVRLLFALPLTGFASYAIAQNRTVELLVCHAIQAQTIMPHLEEMRRIVKTVERCLVLNDKAGLFPVFSQPALTGCTLSRTDVRPDEVYGLKCRDRRVATGRAVISSNGGEAKGMLMIKISGKNRTFWQRIIAHR